MTEHQKLSADAAFERLGQIARQLHQAMSELGFDQHLYRIANEIPDARDRLSYVGQMTDAAAHRVLGLVEKARPGCTALGAASLEQEQLMQEVIESGRGDGPALQAALAFAQKARFHSQAQDEVLGEIMMSQDFQDLSGQVIKRVIDIISRTETQLLQLLSQSAPEHLAEAAAAANEQLQGPQTPEKALKQDDVDDLLASLGF